MTYLDPYTGADAAASQAQMQAINAAGTDVYDRAITSVRDERKAMLDAIAGAGSAGKAEFQRQAEQAELSRSSAVQSALTGARAGTDPATLAAMQARINRPYEEATSARDAASANWSNLFSAMGTSNDAYLGKYAASLPLLQAQARSDLATKFNVTRRQTEAEIAKGQQATQLQLAQLQLQQAQSDAEQRRYQAQIERDNQIRLQEWAREDKQRAEEQAWKQKQFDEDVRRFGLEYALDQQKLAAAGRSGSGSSGYFGSGMTAGEFNAAVPGAVKAAREAFAGISPGAAAANQLASSKLGRLIGLDKAMQSTSIYNVSKATGYPTSAIGKAMGKYETGLTFRPQSPVAKTSYDRANEGLNQGLNPLTVWTFIQQKIGDTPEIRIAFEQAVRERGLPLPSTWVSNWGQNLPGR